MTYTIYLETINACIIGNDDVNDTCHYFEAATGVESSDGAVVIFYGDIKDPSEQYLIPLSNIASMDVIKE